MNLWLLIPVKSFAESKSRLSPILPDAQRVNLSRRMLERLLETVRTVEAISRIVVVSRDPDVLALAAAGKAETVQERGYDLNGALDQARSRAVEEGAEAVMVLPIDLPLLTAKDIVQLCTLGRRQRTVVIAPSRDGGTNALLLRPPHTIDFAFGVNSCQRHRDLATDAGITSQILDSPTLALDLDRPEDLNLLRSKGFFPAVNDLCISSDS